MSQEADLQNQSSNDALLKVASQLLEQTGINKDDFFSAIKRAKFYNAPDVHVPMSDINKHNIKYAHKNKRRVYAFTVNNLKDYELCLACGVDGIFTDNPKYFVQHALAEEQMR